MSGFAAPRKSVPDCAADSTTPRSLILADDFHATGHQLDYPAYGGKRHVNLCRGRDQDREGRSDSRQQRGPRGNRLSLRLRFVAAVDLLKT